MKQKSEKIEYKRKQAALLISQGRARKEIASELQVSLPTLSKYERSDAFKQELESLHNAARQTVSATLTANVSRALDTLVQALKSEKEHTRVKAASIILEKYIQLEKARLQNDLTNPPEPQREKQKIVIDDNFIIEL